MDSGTDESVGEWMEVSWEESDVRSTSVVISIESESTLLKTAPSRGDSSVLKSSVDQERDVGGLTGRGPRPPPCDAEETKILGGACPQSLWNLEDLSLTLLP